MFQYDIVETENKHEKTYRASFTYGAVGLNFVVLYYLPYLQESNGIIEVNFTELENVSEKDVLFSVRIANSEYGLTKVEGYL